MSFLKENNITYEKDFARFLISVHLLKIETNLLYFFHFISTSNFIRFHFGSGRQSESL